MNKDIDKMASFGNFSDNLKELLRNDTEEAKTIISESGIDPEKAVQQGLQFIKKLQFVSQAKLNQQIDNHLIEEAFIRLKQLIKESIGKTGRELQELLIKKAPAFHFRNLENLGDDELKEVLQEIDLIKLMEEIDKERKDNK